MKSKWFALFILILTVALLASACKKNPDSGETPDQSAVSEGLNFAPVEEGSIFYLVEGQHYAGEELVIPSQSPDGNMVTQIGSFGFWKLTGLKKVTLPSTIETINASAFEGCTALSEIVIPPSVERISLSAFEGCTSLSSVTLPNSVWRLGSDAFKGCTALSEITFRGTLEQWNDLLNFPGNSNWIEPDKTLTVHCTDGDTTVG